VILFVIGRIQNGSESVKSEIFVHLQFTYPWTTTTCFDKSHGSDVCPMKHGLPAHRGIISYVLDSLKVMIEPRILRIVLLGIFYAFDTIVVLMRTSRRFVDMGEFPVWTQGFVEPEDSHRVNC
jgi:hypothetical protein